MDGMSELIIKDGEPIDIVADTSLDGTTIESRWESGEYQVFFMRDEKVIAGLTLGPDSLFDLFTALSQGLATRPKAEVNS
jgi:hypothetical protein